jgi:hypothetical protein
VRERIGRDAAARSTEIEHHDGPGRPRGKGTAGQRSLRPHRGVPALFEPHRVDGPERRLAAVRVDGACEHGAGALVRLEERWPARPDLRR